MTTVLKDLYQTVTQKIIAALEAGTPPWIRPWSGGDIDPLPANATTGRAYRGINVLLLNLQAISRGFEHNRWMTFQQALSVGANVRKGEQGTSICFFKLHEVDSIEANLVPAETRKVIPLLRSFTVFNTAQVENLPAAMVPAASPIQVWDALDAAEQLMDSAQVPYRYGGNRAFYSPAEDFIQMPGRASFASGSDFYATALHELTHSTGHPSRCNRPLGRRHGADAYAFEELVAEMGSAFLCAHVRLPGRLQHESYISSWLAALRNDKRLIFTAASQAQKAADYLLPKPTEVASVQPLEMAA